MIALSMKTRNRKVMAVKKGAIQKQKLDSQLSGSGELQDVADVGVEHEKQDVILVPVQLDWSQLVPETQVQFRHEIVQQQVWPMSNGCLVRLGLARGQGFTTVEKLDHTLGLAQLDLRCPTVAKLCFVVLAILVLKMFIVLSKMLL